MITTVLRYVSAAAMGAIVALAAVIVLVLPAHAAVSSQASHGHTRLWWDGATCRAFARGEFHLMVVDSRQADTYLRSDVALWAHDLKRRVSPQVAGVDRSYVGLDCSTTADGE